MTSIVELKANHQTFSNDWQATLAARMADLPAHEARFQASYIRLTSLQAWRAWLIDHTVSAEPLAFFTEAQNDALISHVQAALGSWRVALKSLRSTIENLLLCLYYKDHPIELAKWEQGRFRLPFKEAVPYFREHPYLSDLPPDITGLGLIDQGYTRLSMAVHSSASGFRMTPDGKALSLWKTDQAHESMWATQEQRALLGLNLLMLGMFRDQLQGTALPQLREAIGLVIPKRKDAAIRQAIGVRIRR